MQIIKTVFKNPVVFGRLEIASDVSRKKWLQSVDFFVLADRKMTGRSYSLEKSYKPQVEQSTDNHVKICTITVPTLSLHPVCVDERAIFPLMFITIKTPL